MHAATPIHVAAIQKFPHPTLIKELQVWSAMDATFLGKTNWWISPLMKHRFHASLASQ
jgi:hypothetical protein